MKMTTMNSSDTINKLARQKGWHILQCVDLGTTANVFILEDGSRIYALKTPRNAFSRGRIEVEYQVLRYLAQTPMQQYVPRVYGWLPDVDGFLLEFLRYLNPSSKNKLDTTRTIALILKTLHEVELPVIAGIDDDRPDIANAISERFCHMFDKVLEEHTFWVTLPEEAVPKLEIVRGRYPAYRSLLAEFTKLDNDLNAALIHGDIAGDNVMMTFDERLVLTDWGESRISTPFADIAYLLTYSAWQPREIHQFIQLYFGGETTKTEKALFTIRTLSKLYQYHSCVQSLLWLRESGDEGLDQIGKEHFYRQIQRL